VKPSKTQEAFLAIAGSPCESVAEVIAKLDAAGYWGATPTTDEKKRAHVRRRFRTLTDADGKPLFHKLPKKLFDNSHQHFRARFEEAYNRIGTCEQMAGYSGDWTDEEREYTADALRVFVTSCERIIERIGRADEHEMLVHGADENTLIN
jgi:hypothetical protein